MLPLFEVGDRVMVANESSSYFGVTGVVCQVRPLKTVVEVDGLLFPLVVPHSHLVRSDETNPRIALALIGDDRRAPDGDAWETKMLRKLGNQTK